MGIPRCTFDGVYEAAATLNQSIDTIVLPPAWRHDVRLNDVITTQLQ